MVEEDIYRCHNGKKCKIGGGGDAVLEQETGEVGDFCGEMCMH